MTDEMMALCAMLEEGADADVPRKMISFAAERLMELEVQGLTDVGHGKWSAGRLALPVAGRHSRDDAPERAHRFGLRYQGRGG